MNTRAPRLTRRRPTTTQEAPRRAVANDESARKPARRRGSTLDEVATELADPTAASSLRLDDLAKHVGARSQRRRAGSTLEEVATQLRDPAPASNTNASPLDFALPARPIRVEVISGRGHYDRVIASVTKAHTSVWIATANAKELMIEDPRARPGKRRDHRRARYVSILSILDDLAARGIELRMLHAEIPSGPFREELAQHPRLVAGGLELRRCPRVHMKLVIVDGELLYLGSANWTGAGLGAKGSGRRNFELGLVTDDSQLLDQVQAIYERVWSGGECDDCKLREGCPGPLIELVPRLVTAPPTTPAKKKMPARSQIRRRRVPRLI